MNDRLCRQILDRINEATGHSSTLVSVRAVSGGCINQGWILNSEGRDYFVKTNHEDFLGHFEAESAALTELGNTKTIRVPQPLCSGIIEETAFLALEALTLTGDGDWPLLGKQLAQLHRYTSDASWFGWGQDNVIGETAQPNPQTENWTVFFAESRLQHQINLSTHKGLCLHGVENLLDRLPQILNHDPVPSLLHGDLWSGNLAFLPDGSPTVFDPATYYGDRETDLAFTEMFGRLPQTFYGAYQTEWPLPPGYPTRKRLYNLYHELNHFVLFGGSYGRQAQQTIEWLNESLV